MIIKSIRERLQATLPHFAIVEGAAALSSLKGTPTAMPAAYVLTAREVSGENPFGIGKVRQQVEMDFLVVIVTDDVSDPRGEAAGDAIEQLKMDVRAALLGWEPEGADEHVSHVSGVLTAARNGVVFWEETFATSYMMET